MRRKITSPFIAFTLLCLLILAGLWFASPEPVEGQPHLANHSATLANYQPPVRPNNLSSGGENLELVAQIGGLSYAVAVNGNYAYVGMGSSLIILDIKDPANPTKVGQVILPDIVRDVAIANNYAYLADGYEGLRAINIANPAAPTEVGFFDTPGYALDVAIAGSYAYIADYNKGLRVINIANPAQPTEVGFFDTVGLARNVAIASHRA